PVVMGHSVDEFDWSDPVPGNLIVNGKIGVGVSGPSVTDRLTVAGTIRIIPRSSASCSSSHNGAIYYDSDNHRVYVCKSGAWVEFRGPQGTRGPLGILRPHLPYASASLNLIQVIRYADAGPLTRARVKTNGSMRGVFGYWFVRRELLVPGRALRILLR
ncbi:MAG: hypothetical protein JXC85_01310, partial [Candidatus Aenigmarchaeota archaeon]|nr:hypothetical protein [Candidatus Aenigmarchaeota archaeon]